MFWSLVLGLCSQRSPHLYMYIEGRVVYKWKGGGCCSNGWSLLQLFRYILWAYLDSGGGTL